MSTTVARPSWRPVVRLSVTSSWLVLVLVGPYTAWAGFAVAYALARKDNWRGVAVVGTMASLVMLPVHIDGGLPWVDLVVWTVLCLAAAPLNAHILRSRLVPVPTRPARRAKPTTSRSRGGPDGPRRGPKPTSGRASDRGQRPAAPDDTPRPAWGTPPASTRPTVPVVQDRVDVNTAPSARLRTLPGVSRSAAQRAVQHRQRVGAFQSLDEFAQVARLEGTDLLRLRERASCPPSDR